MLTVAILVAVLVYFVIHRLAVTVFLTTRRFGQHPDIPPLVFPVASLTPAGQTGQRCLPAWRAKSSCSAALGCSTAASTSPRSRRCLRAFLTIVLVRVTVETSFLVPAMPLKTRLVEVMGSASRLAQLANPKASENLFAQ